MLAASGHSTAGADAFGHKSSPYEEGLDARYHQHYCDNRHQQSTNNDHDHDHYYHDDIDDG